MEIKQVLTTGILGATLVIGFTGCGPEFEPHPQTIKFAKKHNLKNKDYQRSEIMCITNKPLSSKDLRELLAIIMSKMSNYYLKLCQSNFYQMTSSHPETNWRPDYERCRHYAIPSVKQSMLNIQKINDKTFKHEFKFYQGIYTMNEDEGELLAYLGFDETLGYDILYAGDITEKKYFSKIKNPTKIGIIKDSINEFKKRHPNICKTLDK